MKASPWVSAKRISDDEIERQINSFKQHGGEVIELNENFSIKPSSPTAIKLGKTHVKVRSLIKNK